jgi:hypothetical protein
MEEGEADIDDVMTRVARVDQLRAQARGLEAQAAALHSGGALALSQGRAVSRRVSSTNRHSSVDSTSKPKTLQGGDEDYTFNVDLHTEADVELEEAFARVKVPHPVALVEGLLAGTGTAKTRTPSNTGSSFFAYFGKDKGTASTLLGVDDFPEALDFEKEGSPGLENIGDWISAQRVITATGTVRPVASSRARL